MDLQLAIHNALSDFDGQAEELDIESANLVQSIVDNLHQLAELNGLRH